MLWRLFYTPYASAARHAFAVTMALSLAAVVLLAAYGGERASAAVTKMSLQAEGYTPKNAQALIGAARVIEVPCRADLDAKVNRDPSTTATRFVLSSCKYATNQVIVPKNGDEIAGPVGTFTQRGPAFDPNTSTTITAASGVENVFRPRGTVKLKWVRIVGGTGTPGQAGSGTGIAGGRMSDDSVLYAVEVTGSDAVGFSNAHGIVERSEFWDTTNNPLFLGFTAAGIKAIGEMEIKNSYIHDNQGNGLWCDQFCDDRNTEGGKYWVHENLVVNNGRAGIRWEKVSADASSGEALIENNRIAGNGYGASRAGVSIHDGANAVVRGNVFGPGTIAGISYGYDSDKVAIRISDSRRTDRPHTRNVSVTNNAPNGEVIEGCYLNGTVACWGNSRVVYVLLRLLEEACSRLQHLLHGRGAH
jgi:hypothetical protein